MGFGGVSLPKGSKFKTMIKYLLPNITPWEPEKQHQLVKHDGFMFEEPRETLSNGKLVHMQIFLNTSPLSLTHPIVKFRLFDSDSEM